MNNTKKCLLLASLSSVNIHSLFGCCGKSSTSTKNVRSEQCGTNSGSQMQSDNSANSIPYNQLLPIASNALKNCSYTPDLIGNVPHWVQRIVDFAQAGQVAHTPTSLNKEIWFGSMMPNFTDATKVVMTYCGDNSESKDLFNILFYNNEDNLVLSLTIKDASLCYGATKKLFEATQIGGILSVPIMGVVVELSEDFKQQRMKEALKNKDLIKKAAQLKSLKNIEKLLTQISMLELHFPKDAKINRFSDLFNTKPLGMILYETEYSVNSKSYSCRTQLSFGNIEKLTSGDEKSCCLYGSINKIISSLIEKSSTDQKAMARNNYVDFWGYVNDARAFISSLVNVEKNGSNISAHDEHEQYMESKGLNKNGTSYLIQDSSE